MKKYLLFNLLIILIIFNISCFNRAKTENKIVNQAKQATYEDFFYHMTGNKIFEKMRNKNYYILRIDDEKFIYYGKPIRKNKKLEIYKVDKNHLESEFPLYHKIDGLKLMEIIRDDYQDKNGLEQGSMHFHDSEYKLNGDIIESKIKFYVIKGKRNNEVISELEEVSYELDSKDLSIIKRN